MTIPSRILITGATGLIGQALCQRLTERGAQVFALGRHHSPTLPEQVSWIPWSGKCVPDNLPGELDAVINLTGESIAAGRWTLERKEVLAQSRVETTRWLIAGLKQSGKLPSRFLSASASGFYGNRGEQLLTESSGPGEGFLVSLTRAWEQAAREAVAPGCSVTLMRFSVVLSEKGGALPRMMLPFRFGLGGRISSGTQFMSWITLDDLLSAIEFLLQHPLEGAVNLSAPEACTNREFTRALARALKRPAFFPVPARLLKSVFGEMADELFLASTRVSPRKLTEAGFNFQSPDISSAFRHLFKK